MADHSDTEVLAGIFGGLVVAIAAVAVVIGAADGVQSRPSPEPRSIEPDRNPATSPAKQSGDPRESPWATDR